MNLVSTFNVFPMIQLLCASTFKLNRIASTVLFSTNSWNMLTFYGQRIIIHSIFLNMNDYLYFMKHHFFSSIVLWVFIFWLLNNALDFSIKLECKALNWSCIHKWRTSSSIILFESNEKIIFDKNHFLLLFSQTEENGSHKSRDQKGKRV